MIKTIFTTFVALTLLSSCGGSGRQSDTAAAGDTISATSSVTEDLQSTTENDIALIHELYTGCVWANDVDYDPQFLIDNCTPELVQRLRDAYDMDGDGLAVWLFRSDNQDGPEDSSAILSITPLGEGRYSVEISDMGVWATKTLVITDSKISDVE